MKLTPVIAALRARCPYFENRVAGAAQFKNLPEVGKLRLPAAYVVPGDDSPGENKSQTDYWQELKEGFSVVVILSNGRDERGQFASYDVVDDVRQMLFKALLGWNPEACGNPITYDGGTLLDLNRHELIYQFDFSVISELTEDDTRHPIACANNFCGDAECRSGAGNNTRAEHWLAFRHASGTEQCTGGEKHG